MNTEAYNLFGDLEGVGSNIAEHLWRIGMRSKDDIANADPEEMFNTDCELQGGYLDRCVLYVYRCVHSACNAELQGNSLDEHWSKWWNWSDKNLAENFQKPPANPCVISDLTNTSTKGVL